MKLYYVMATVMVRSTYYIRRWNAIASNPELAIEKTQKECGMNELDVVLGWRAEENESGIINQGAARKCSASLVKPMYCVCSDGDYYEYVQECPWSSGPVIFLALRKETANGPIVRESLWDEEEIDNA